MHDQTGPGFAAAGASLQFPPTDASVDARKQATSAFLGANGWGGITPVPLAGDASFRRYYRLQDNGRRAVLMDAPPQQEDVGPYIAIAGLLREIGLSAPEVFAEDRS